MLLADVQRLCGLLTDPASTYRQQMNELLNLYEIEAFKQRVDKLIARRKFPVPGPGPNYPWPAV
jgi:hypothetical protein